MQRLEDPWIVSSDDGRMSVYQIISTSHVIVHFGRQGVHADLFSCEPFDMDACVKLLLMRVGSRAVVQYCQRNLLATPRSTTVIPMRQINRLTSNPRTFTHALINFYGGEEELLGDARRGTEIIRAALEYLEEREPLPPSPVRLLEADPVSHSWDRGGISGGCVNLMKQLTVHTFKGINGAYADIMAHCFDLERIVEVIRKGFRFGFYEVDAVFQRSVAP
jgi:hypothetical protein